MNVMRRTAPPKMLETAYSPQRRPILTLSKKAPLEAVTTAAGWTGLTQVTVWVSAAVQYSNALEVFLRVLIEIDASFQLWV
jgi:hypothetical protein